jgi:hypothetical protein
VLRFRAVKQPIDKWMFVPTINGQELEPSDEGYNKVMKNVCFMVLVMNMDGMMKNVSWLEILVLKFMIDLVSLTMRTLLLDIMVFLFILSDTAIKKLKL